MTIVEEIILHEKRIVKTPKELESLFDLSRFKVGMDSDDYYKRCKRIEDARAYLEENCNLLGTEPLSDAVNPIKLSCGFLEYPLINSHGEVEFWVRDRRVFDFKNHTNHGPIRRSQRVPEGAILVMDTKKLLDQSGIMHHNVLGLTDFELFGFVRNAYAEKRHIPGSPHFIEVGAISYSDIGNTWQFGILGGNFNLSEEARE